MAVAKLRNVRLIFPKMWSPNDKGKYLCGVLIEKDSPAYTELMRAIKEAWAAGRQKFGGTSFCENPTLAQVMNRAYLKADGGLDSKGNPVPEYYAGCIGFTGNSRKPIPVIDVTGAPVAEGDQRVYDGQRANVSVDIIGAIAQSVAAVGTDPVALQGALENLNYEGITCDIVIDPATHMPTDCFMFMYTYDNQDPVMLEQFAG